MGQEFIIDSNVVIDYLAGNLPAWGMNFLNRIVNKTPFVSVITKIEVLGFKSNVETSKLLSGFFPDSIIIALNANIVDITIEIRKQHKIKTPDAIIAASAMNIGFGILTRNTKDFNTISGLKLINPFDL